MFQVGKPCIKGDCAFVAHLENIMKRLKITALVGAIACLLPTVALAQSNNADSAYINDLFSFLKREDAMTYNMASKAMSPEDSVWAARMFCQAFSSGASPANVYSAYTEAAIGEAATYGEAFNEEVAYSIGLYGGAVMNLGSAHYCPQYQPQVEQALRSL